MGAPVDCIQEKDFEHDEGQSASEHDVRSTCRLRRRTREVLSEVFCKWHLQQGNQQVQMDYATIVLQTDTSNVTPALEQDIAETTKGSKPSGTTGEASSNGHEQ